MRKYQQLLLLVLSCISIIVLFIYKSENNRLKYVLQVVNFFGRKDAAFLGQFDNFTNDNTDFAHPLPVWQSLDNSFHAYAAYWFPSKLNNGEAVAEVVGKRDANVLFRCFINYENGSTKEGKFRFQPWEQQNEINNVEFIIYSFYCQISTTMTTKTTNLQAESVLFSTRTHAATLRLRTMQINSDNNSNANALQAATLCLDMTSSLQPLRLFYKNNKYMLQFFLHHKALGIDNFLVYNSDALSSNLLHVLRQAQVQLHAIPFNFPFATNDEHTIATQIRQIIKVNCIRRSALAANYTMVLSANEFLYAKNRLNSPTSILHATQQPHAAKPLQLHINKVNICLNAQKTLLIDNSAYDASQSIATDIILYPLHGIDIKDTNSLLGLGTQAKVATNAAFVHTYVECVNIGADGLDDWRHKLKEDFLHYLQAERTEMSMFVR